MENEILRTDWKIEKTVQNTMKPMQGEFQDRNGWK